MTGGATISRVLVAVDFDHAAAAALRVAGALAAARHAELTVLHAATDALPAYFTVSQIAQLEAEREETRRLLADQLRRFAEQQVTRPFKVIVADGPPPDAVARIAAAFDLIAVGTHRRHGPQRWWLGSVAEAIVRHSPRPVLVVPTGASAPARGHTPTILAAGADGAAAEAWVDAFTTTWGGTVVREPDLRHCAPDRIPRADLIVLAMPAGERHEPLSAMTHVLKECVYPVLFVPCSEETAKRSKS